MGLFGGERKEAAAAERARVLLGLGLSVTPRTVDEIDERMFHLLPSHLPRLDGDVMGGRLGRFAVEVFEWRSVAPRGTTSQSAGVFLAGKREHRLRNVTAVVVEVGEPLQSVVLSPASSGDAAISRVRKRHPTGNAWLDEWFVCGVFFEESAKAVDDATFVHRFAQLPHGTHVELKGDGALLAVHEPLPPSDVAAFVRATLALAEVIPGPAFDRSSEPG